MRESVTAVVPASRFEVILVSSSVRCRLRARLRIRVTNV